MSSKEKKIKKNKISSVLLHNYTHTLEEKNLKYSDISSHWKFLGNNSSNGSSVNILKHGEKGLIERMSVESDARLKKIVLTDKSREHEERITRDLLKFEADTQVGISDEDLDVFDRVTNIIMANLKNIND